ncbi:MAG: TonB-dependent receptor [Sphingomonas sp.]|uniref:TonB-dependent receptor n=1 Tax=Sphingomonas sp. TaxID=28214 RepID=UPI001B127D96|nr:TonB-dependent receptor [Sphingomonas sp.]MBO9623821.1 TonB-dependent receptor [Sphingomonas sp.]
MQRQSLRHRLLIGTVLAGAIGMALPVHAQDAAPVAADAAAEPQDSNDEIVVTGSIFARRTDRETASPLTTLSAEMLDQRGITSVAEALRSVSADNSGSIPIAFSNGFASGASGVSLRGLGVNSTLVLFDGLRGSYYPLADDGQKSFVDLNTIPQFAVERVEVLRDGASATYGADAIGGVINIITRKQFQGVSGMAEAGVSERGDVGNQRFSLMAGTGDLDTDGFSAYIGGEYSHSDDLMARRRGFPYNTGDLSPLTCTGSGDPEPCANGNIGATGPGQTISALVRRANQLIPGNVFSGEAIAGERYQVLNPAGCAPGTIAHSTTAGGSFCEQDFAHDYGQLQPEQERWGITGRVTARLGGDLEAYAIGTYYRSEVDSVAAPSAIRNRAPANTLGVVLPARLTNGQLNPNNPFAAEGYAAQIAYTFGDIPISNTTASSTYRGALGVSGSLGEKGRFALEATAMHTDLDWTRRGYINVAALGRAIADGSYNFVNPALNTDAVRSALAPTVTNRSTSDLVMAQLTATYAVAELPGGPLQIGGTASIRHERLNAPNANPDSGTVSINPVNARGQRTVSAASIEIDAPVLDAVQLNLAGRFDHYSDGYDRFSPKAGIKVTPFRGLALRGTYSQGFRAPQFAELQGSVTGYVTAPIPPCDVVIAHGGVDEGGGECSGGSPYVGPNNALGINTTGTPGLKPERSRSFTVGAVFEPARWFSATIDYYNISKKDFIAGAPDYGAALAAYYAGEPLPDGYSVLLNDADPLYPNAPRTVAFVNASYVNAAEQRTSGIDVTATLDLKLGGGVRWLSQFEATRILEFNLVAPGGTQQYVGTQGPYALSSGAGTPAWRANWQNTVEFGPASLSATAYYTSGYRNTAEDISGPDTKDDCDNALADPAFCRTKHFLVVDMVATYKVSDDFSFYVNVNNLFDAKAPINLPNYAANNYNPTWSQSGVIGRAFRAGTRFRF